MYCVRLGDKVLYAGTDPKKAAIAAEKVGKALLKVRNSDGLKLENTDGVGSLPKFRPHYDHSQDSDRGNQQ
jgi:hypothetical protein